MQALQNALHKQCSRHLCALPTAIRNNLANENTSFGKKSILQNAILFNKMIFTHPQSNQFQQAQYPFDKMPLKNVVSENSTLSAFNKAKNPGEVYKCFIQMLRVGIIPNEYTVSMVLAAALDNYFNNLLPQVHALVVPLGLNMSVFVGSTLIKAYAAMGDRLALSRVFDEIMHKDATSWNILVSSYMKLGCLGEAKRVFDLMPEKNVISWTNLVNGYIANNKINKARSLFNKMSEKNVVSWTVMINGYVRNERFVHALELFCLMGRSETRPNHFTFSSVLDACAGCSSLLMGQQVHSIILKAGMPDDDVILFTSLVDMYGKCGDIDSAFSVFELMKKKNVVSWNSIIGGYARHGLATRALEVFERMIKSGVGPDEVTFTNLLSACVHGGLVEEGEKHFRLMEEKCGIQASLEHYTCMVDLYGRAGQLEKAEKLIKEMPFEPDVVVWGALLGACGLHSSLELGEFAAKGIQKLKADHPLAYSMLLKIHGEREEWNGMVELREMKEQQHVKNQMGGSWIESVPSKK